MKFTLTVTDATAEEIAALVRNLDNGVPATVSLPLAPPIAGIPPMPPMGEPDEDDDEPGAAYDSVPGAPVERDANGLPWDARIHSKNRTRNADQTWRKAKGVDPATIAAVEQELRAVPAQPLPPPPVVAPPIAGVPPMPVPQPEHTAALPPLSTLGNGAAPPPPAVDTVPPAATGPMDFPTFFQQLQPRLQQLNPATGQPFIDAPYLADLTARISAAWNTPLNAITDLMTNPNAGQILEWAIATMRAEGRWQ